MDTHASAQKEEKADCQSPKDESPTNDGSEPPILLGADGELAIVESRKRSRQARRSHGRRRANKQAVTVDNGEELLQKLTLLESRRPASSSSRRKQKADVRTAAEMSLYYEEHPEKLFPWAESNHSDWNRLAQELLIQRYRKERGEWSNEKQEEFHLVAPKLNYTLRNGYRLARHPIYIEACTSSVTWIHAWFLQVIFGGTCAGQPWFECLAMQHPQLRCSSERGVGHEYRKRVGRRRNPKGRKQRNTDTPDRSLDQNTPKATSDEPASQNNASKSDTRPYAWTIRLYEI